MNILLLIFLIIGLVIAIFLIVALFIRKEYSIEREISINKPKKVVFDYIKLLKNQNYYSKWQMMDPDMNQDYSGIDGTVGFSSSWDSNDKRVGKGEQKIKKIIEGERIEFDIHFIKPFEGIAIAYMITEPLSEKKTKVKWGFYSTMKYPMNMMLLFMNMDKMVGNDLSTGLTNLKNILEITSAKKD
jgi:hypothetical protein